MDNHNTSLFTKTMSFVVVSLGIFLRVYAFCINPTQGLYTPLPVDMTDTIRISTEEPQKDAEYVPGEIIVKFKPTQVNLKTFAGQRSVQNFAAEQDLLPTDSVANANLVLLEVDDSMSIEQKIRELESDPTVEYAEPNYVRHLLSTVNDYNDTYADQMWGLTKIQWPNAMDVLDTYPSLTDILVAVIDVGVAYDHPDLVNQMRDGSDCKSYTGVTIAGWCVHGYDFYDNDNDPYPRNFSIHGTHVAWTIAAQINNATWIMGVNPHTKIMAIRAWDTNYLDSFAIIKWVQFATQNHAKVINASYGGTGYSTSEYNAINNFGLSWWLFIAAAGNNGRNNEIPANHSYPSDYNLPNILSVAATTDTDDLASFSNYGSTSVDVWAPGYSILSTIISSGVMFTENFSSSFTEKRIATWTNPSRWIIGGQLYGDVNRSPYTANSDTTITLISGIDLSSLHDATIAWYTQCDTELSAPSANSDYMALEYSSDGTTFTELGKRNELTLRNTNRFGDNYITYLFNPPSSNLTSTFSLRFRRHSDNDDNNYIGCLIDDIRILYPVGAYKSLPGTSMATPHVVGLASMLRSANSGLSYTQIKNIIMSSGDSLSALSGKTVSGKRINMYASLAALWLPSSAPNRWDVYSSLSNLLSGQWIHNNLNSVTSSGITNVSGLYFAVRDASRELWKITFTTGIDLSNSDTQYFISGYLADALDIELWHIAFTPAAWFINQPATITLYIDQVASWFLSTLTRDSFAVTTSENESLDPKEIISTVTTWTCTNGLCPIYLAVEHFTAFDIRPILHTVHIASNNSFSSLLAQNGDEITITFSSLETLTPEPIAIINDKIFSGNDLSGQVDRSVSFIVGTDVSIDDGEIAFALSYIDSNGNTGEIVNSSTDNSFVIVSNSPSSPSTPTITSMVSLTRTDTVTLTWTTSAHALVTLFDHGERDQVVTQWFSDRDGRFSIVAPLTEGTHELQAYATNIAQELSNDSNILTITRDSTPPIMTGTSLVWTPIVSGGYYATGVSFNFSGSDISGATLNGTPYTSDTPILVEWAYTFVLQDIAGNTSSLSFTLDFTAPTFLGAEDNHIYNHSLIITGTDNFAFSGFELNNIFSLDMIISIDTDGTYTLTWYDRAGNSAALQFSIDQVAPTITWTTLVGTPVISGEYYATGVSFSFSGSNISGATLNGNVYTSNTPIITEWAYTFVLQDIAGNTSSLSFTLDFTAPTFLGAEDNHIYNHTLIITGTDNFAFSGFELNNIFSLDMIISIDTDGTYTLTWYDRAGNSSALHFSIDQVAPTITWTTLVGTPVISGGYYATGVSFSFSGSNISGATLNGNVYTSDTPIITEWAYTFVLQDIAGNTSSLSFTLDFTAPLITLLLPTHGSQISDTNTVVFTWSGSDVQAMSGYSFVLSGSESRTISTTNTTYTTTLASGSYMRSVIARDRAGNTRNSSGYSFILNSPLTTTITLLTGNLYYHSTRYTKDYANILITTTAPTTYSITGDFTTSPLTWSLTDRFTWTVILSSPDGQKSIFVQATNDVYSTGKSFSLLLDTTAPSTPLLTSAGSGTTLSGAFTLDRSDAIDSGAGISGYQYFISSVSGTQTTWILLSWFTSSSSVSISNGTLASWVYYRYVKAIDMLGNLVISSINSFGYSGSIDNIPDQFTFEDITDADLNESYLSEPVIITWLSANTPVLASLSKWVLYIRWDMVGATWYLQNGRDVQIELISRNAYDSVVSSKLTIGWVSDTFSITTKEADDVSDTLSKTQKLQVVAIFQVLQDLYQWAKAKEFLESLLLMIENQMDDYDDDELEYITLSYLYDLVEDYYDDEFDSNTNNDIDAVSWIVNGVYTAPNGKKYTITYDSKKQQFTSTNFITPKYFPTLDVLKYTIDMSNPVWSAYANAKTIKARWGKVAIDGTRQTSAYTAPNRKVFYFFKTMAGKYSSYTFSSEKYFDSLEATKAHIYANNPK